MAQEVPKTDRSCRHCGASFRRPPCQIAYGWGNFCSDACRVAWRRRPEVIAASFWANVNKDGPVVRPALEPCWQWMGAIDKKSGYGRASNARRRKTTSAHRRAWELTFGPIPDGLWVLHTCDNRLCCNPAHLFLGTHADNMRDMMAKGRNRFAPLRGEANPRAKFTEASVAAMRFAWSTGNYTYRQLADSFGMSDAHVRHIISGVRWAHTNPNKDAKP